MNDDRSGEIAVEDAERAAMTERAAGMPTSADSPDDAAALQHMMERARAATELLKALSHEGRLMILCLLAEGEKTVSDLERRLGLSQAAVSQQLARLRYDRLVRTRRDGRSIHYAIASEEARAVIGTLYQVFCKGSPPD